MRLESRQGVLDARDPVLAEALHSLMMVCTYGGEEDLWRPFEDAMARSDGIPIALDLNSKIFADPAHAGATALEALESAIAALADESDPAQIIRIGMSASYVDRLEGCRDALWRVVRDARRRWRGRVGDHRHDRAGVDDLEAGDWDEAERLVEEAIQVCEAHGYQASIWPCRFVQGVLAAARGDDERAEELADELIQWAGPRGIRVGQLWAWQVRGLAALGQGDFEEAYQQASRISPPGLLAPHTSRMPSGCSWTSSRRRFVPVATPRRQRTSLRCDEANLAALSSRLALVVGGSTAMAAPDDTALELFQAALALPGSSGGSSTSPGCGWPTANACGAAGR